MITALASYLHVLRAKGAPNAFLGEGRGMNGVMYKPSPVVVPQVMVEVARVKAEAG